MRPLPADARVDADEDGDVFVVTPRVRLDADYACFRKLGWRCLLLDEQSEPARAAERLTAAGYADATRTPQVLELTHPRGHRVVIVPRTRRVQIRIDVDTPLGERVAAAVHVAEEVAAASARLKGS